jgi:hypothetical protein
MRTYQETACTDIDIFDILYAGHKTDLGVGLGHRRRFLDCCGFPFSISFWNIFLTELRDSVVFSVAKTVFSTFDVYCAYGSAHTFSDRNLPVYYPIRGWVLQGLGEFRLG